MKNVIISVGGSLIIQKNISTSFLKALKKIVIINKNLKFFFVAGGGSIARKYVNAAEKVTKLKKEDKDWLGIHATRLNAHLLRTIFRDLSYHKVLKNYSQKIKTKKKVIIASGWRPGHSTDYDAVQFALLYRENVVINLTNTDYVYTKDPKKYKDAKPIKNIHWKDYFKLIPKNWKPGMHAPFDVHASKLAAKNKIKVILINGNKLDELQNYLNNKYFNGTVIE